MASDLQISSPEPVDLWRFDVFDAEAFGAWISVPNVPPEPCRSGDCELGRVIWIEPAAFLLCPRRPVAPPSPPQGVGAVTDVSGSLCRMAITGGAWRSLLTLEGLLDVEGPGFSAGVAASSIIHHTPILLDVIGPDRADVYVSPSLSRHLSEFWAAAVASCQKAVVTASTTVAPPSAL